jgi:adenosylcobinamide-phosphate synthase
VAIAWLSYTHGSSLVAHRSAAILLGAALDAALGDPPGWPHPVRAIGALISRGETIARRVAARLGGGSIAERAAGVVLALVVMGVTGGVVAGIVVLCDRIGGLAAVMVRGLLVYWGVAARSLGGEALRASEAPDLGVARRELAMIVGRDTGSLDWPEIRRACVETIGENTNDAVIAPLFWFVIGGPIGMWVYKAINTLDSMVGYRNERYRWLGWASARMDDVANIIPARLTWILMSCAAAILLERPWSAFRTGWRDSRKHPSPNSAWGEAAMAGALGIQLGGPSTYSGVPSVKPFLGDACEPITLATVRRSARLLWVTSLLAYALAWSACLALQ